MLALTRKVGERIVIGDDIVVTVVGIKGDNIRLTIEAPREIKIYRGEIYDAIAAENKEASASYDLAKLNELSISLPRTRIGIER
ncbi:carbon storage regulator CsrA [Desulfitobacterium dichloroeliminans LMG P-21439]|uniref:Translational regulator CsrA n=1 Tax=Desulfitobacterium dichloroeliminans (strain LMG P-21439 / DCA1) TaxID=871963 RepID=L0FAR2_DESDL|nr:carbon storage regulator CsrA [Desulfitobacterium dichloroeliminans]AGA70317.1 carbon storage regulator CsrA [Desulfitobacterium dichloroeliminans LMG P-21439]